MRPSSPRSPKKTGRSGVPARLGPVGRRHTRQREAVLALLGQLDGFRTVREIYTALREHGERIGLTTVYRVLQILVDLGEVDVLRSSSGDGLYRLCGRGHHHHLMCRTCGRVVEISGPDVENWTDQIATEHGFTEVGHSLEILGTCAECVSSAGPSGADEAGTDRR